MTELAWMQQWYALCDKWRDQGYDALTADEKVWFTIRALIDLTENGGIVGYYCNSGADHVDDCMAALDRLGAHDVRHQVERVNALFGEGVADFYRRNQIISSWPDDDERFDKFLDEVDNRLFSMFPDLEERLERFLQNAGLI